MTTSTLGRAVACLEAFAAGLCLTIVASAFLSAVDAQTTPPSAPVAAVSTPA
ncbi:hypothetical protein [Brevundimonas sp. FT23028]|uniref:hypothetical protein n=1 Tax=Brevundimonas sp. FT23028 TaxID=3393748 RepID=UPI003B586EA5